MWHLGYKYRSYGAFFSTLIIWELYFKVQTSFEAQNFMPLLSLSLHSFSPTFKLLSMASYGGELLLDSSSPWSGISNHLSSFSIPLPWSWRSKGLHWWRRSKVYKLHMELHHILLHVTVRVGMRSFFSLQTTIILPFLGTTWIRLTQALSEIR